jgi:hypothetical protein
MHLPGPQLELALVDGMDAREALLNALHDNE